MRTLLLVLMLTVTSSAFAAQKKEIAKRIASVSLASGLDPDLAVAIATVESGLNPNAVGGLGEVGLFQLRPEYHKVMPGNTEHNILVGVAYLVELQSRFSDTYGPAWFVLFNYGPARPPKYPERTSYYKKVMTEFGKIKTKRYLVLK